MKKRKGQAAMSLDSKRAKMTFVPVTRVSTTDVETVKFDNPDDLKNSSNHVKKNIPKPDNREELDMKKTRFEIMKFGMSSLKSEKLEDAEEALAISLGAAPRKRANINYKILQVEKKKEKLLKEELDKQNLKPILKSPKNKKNVKGKSQKGQKKQSGNQKRRPN